LGSPLVAELLSHSGIDFTLLDTQHGSWGPDATIQALAAMAAGPAVPMVRVAYNNYTLIGRLLDEGALGVVVPLVNSPDDARAAARRRADQGWRYLTAGGDISFLLEGARAGLATLRGG